MKKLKVWPLFFLLQLGVLYTINAQILDPRRVMKRKAEDKVNQKIDQAFDKAFDKIFESGSNKSASADSSKSEGKTNRTNADREADAMANTILKGLSMSGTPKSTYSFDASYSVKMSFEGKKPEDGYTIFSVYRFGNEGKAIGSEVVRVTNPEMYETMKMMKATIIDLEQEKMFMFMDNNGQKTVMGLGYNGTKNWEELAKKQNDKTTYTKLNKTKQIGKYLCDGYLVSDGESNEYTIWISQQRVPLVVKYYDTFSKMSGNQKNQKYSFQAYGHPDFLKFMQEGRAMLGMDNVEKDSKFSMEILDIKESDPMTFDTAAYTNLSGK